MTSTVDRFTAFVESLASHLDDHEARGEDLAARMYLSRFHFDRLITSAAGESPSRFRRRVLLERAAFRLLTTNMCVLDVAVEAGYGSNEAFTRAFQRHYGAAPSSWRLTPTQLHLPAPNGVHFHPPGGLRLPALTKVTPMDLLIQLVEHHIAVIGRLIDGAARLDDEQLDAPIELSVEGIDDHPSIRSVLSRLVGQMAMWNASAGGRAYDFDSERNQPISSMRARLDTEGAAFLAQVREVAEDGRLDDTFVDAVCDPPEVFTYAGMVGHVLTYAAYRRTLVTGALYSAGVTDIEDDPLHWFAPSA